MKKLFFNSVFIFSLFFLGCSSKKIDTVNNITLQNNISKISSQQDDFLDEFEQELKVEKKDDPLEGYNRVMTDVNDKLYEYIMKPVSIGYKKITNRPIRESIGNFFHNLAYPVRLVNNVLQGKFQNSVEETGRFVLNSTIGVLGLFDVAKNGFGLEPHNEDFGQTLGYWGVEPGPHIVLPFLGPSNLRDALSLYPNSYLNPIAYYNERGYNLVDSLEQSLGILLYEQVNGIANEDLYEIVKKDAIDLYPYLRDVYEQRRQKQIEE